MGYTSLRGDLIDVQVMQGEEGQQELTSATEVPHPYFGTSYPVQHAADRRFYDTESLEDYGFKDDAGLLYKERRNDRVIINITGGSVARGLLDYGGENVLRAELQKHPAFDGKNIVFSSTAFYGHRHPQQLTAITYLMSLGAQYDIIVDISGVNELIVGKMYSGDASPYYPFKWHEIISMKYPDAHIHALRGKVQYLREKRAALVHNRENNSLGDTMTASLIWKVMDNRLRNQIREAEYELATNAPIEDLTTLMDTGPVPQYDESDEYFQDMASVWGNSVRQLARLSEANNITFLSVLQPNQYVGNHPFTKKEKAIAYIETGPYMPLVQGGYPYLHKAAQVLQQEGVTFWDATGVFDTVTDAIYTDDCCHFNTKKANAVFAKALAEHIIAAY